MKIKVKEVIGLMNELVSFKLQNITWQVNYFVEKNLLKIQKEMEQYSKEEKKLFEKYGEKIKIIPLALQKQYQETIKKATNDIEKQKIKQAFEKEDYEIKKEGELEFKKELEKIQDGEIELDFYKINIDKFGKGEIKNFSMAFSIKYNLIEEG